MGFNSGFKGLIGEQGEWFDVNVIKFVN